MPRRAPKRKSAARELVRVHDRIVRTALSEGGGLEIKHTGDGIMACFPSAPRALVADVVRQLAAGKDFLFRLESTRCLEGMSEAVPLFEVVWQEEESSAGIVASA